jgi:hypothetical protein
MLRLAVVTVVAKPPFENYVMGDEQSVPLFGTFRKGPLTTMTLISLF